MITMSKLMSMKNHLEQTLKDESRPLAKVFSTIEEKTGVDRLYAFIGFVVFITIYLMFGCGQQLVCNIFGFIYPAYCSMKALESKTKDDDTKWLTYWVVFATFTVVEFFVDYIVWWFPFYWLTKCLLYVWLMAPIENNGSILLYRRFVRPCFLRYQPQLDKFMSSAKNATVKMMADALTAEKHD